MFKLASRVFLLNPRFFTRSRFF